MNKSINDVLQQFREEATSNRDLGDRFERLICRYLQIDPLYADRFSNVWMWNDWPLKGKVGDVGIDLVAQEKATGDYCAVQCKFYLPDHTIAKEDIDSFFTAAGKTQFSSCLIVSTTDKWSKNAEHALFNQSKPVFRLRVQDLDASPVDWSRFSLQRPQDIGLRKRKTLMEHQKDALQDVVKGLDKADRGKLIMACGTGKTFTALKIAEHMAPQGHVLFLVPSLSLLSQSLREWTAEASPTIHSMAVCSDTKVGKRETKDDADGSDFLTYDLAFPATTSSREILRQYRAIKEKPTKGRGEQGMAVVFSTYQSIAAVSEAQKGGLPEFDLIVCDEAHRTTGVTLSGEDESHFIKVHDPKFIKAKKRLYMTATPRIYGDESKVKAKEASAELCSMDNPAYFGEELHRLGFGEAVSKGLLSDYKVLVLAVNEKYVSKTFQRLIADTQSELRLDDAVKIAGCWNGLAKRVAPSTDPSTNLQEDVAPMRRAVAFSRSIKDSKSFVDKFTKMIEDYRGQNPDEEGLLHCELEHVDGTFDSLRRNGLLDWLKANHESNACRILSNARCLSEGVDVPALDAVLFLNPRNSMVDVVQSVGRVMRRAEGKRYGYIILPIGIPADVPAEEALKDNDKYKVVWQVLQALRAHDDRFNAQVNHIELNRKKPESIQVIGVGCEYPEHGPGEMTPARETQNAFDFPHLEEWKDAIYAKVVLKCGDRRYWESWAKDVAQIAERHTTRIKALLDDGDAKHKKAFAAFLDGLRKNINPSISESDAVEMLSQHLITRPVFDALFEGYTFTQENPVSKAMQRMVNALQDQALEKETATLEKFYASVRERAAGIDNAEGKQRVVVELYDKFFRAAFPKMAERLGIVYTPVEVVDFIVHSVNDVLKDEFDSSLSDKDVHIIDPFTGTGTFIVRLLQSRLIRKEDLERKYLTELHANEIVLLAYYIAAINIEEAFHGLNQEAPAFGGEKAKSKKAYTPFEGIVLTDTFQLFESKGVMEEQLFPENNKRLARQKQSPIRVVMANPPYSAGQDSENDNNKALKYPALDERIRSTYAAKSSATLVKNLYDSYIRAIRWASDRIKDKGVIGFVTNGSFIDGNNMDGLRACLSEEFSGIYVFNLRGNQRTSGETSRMEGGKIFGSGSRAGIAISLLVRNPEKNGKCEIRYHDIGDYLDREKKLAILKGFQSINGIQKEKKWKRIQPNTSHDWINQRDPAFETFVSLGDKKDDTAKTVFELYSQGVLTSRDKWCYNFSGRAVEANMGRMIEFYNEQVARFAKITRGKSKSEISELLEKSIDTDEKQISWSGNLKGDLEKLQKHAFTKSDVVMSLYRPFCKQTLFHNRDFNERVYQLPRLFPKPGMKNVIISVDSRGSTKEFSVLMTDVLPDYELISKGQSFPLFIYEKNEPRVGELFTAASDGELNDGYRRKSAVTDAVLKDFRAAYGPRVSKEDIFYYVYGVLHSPEYRERFASDLKKMLPRLPMTQEAKDFRRFTDAGRELGKWHVDYETVEPYPLKEESSELALDQKKHFIVEKMSFARKGKEIDKSRIIYNSRLTLSGIPLGAYDYIVNGKPALEWIMERYQVTKDPDSGILNDPNDWTKETKQPRYIVDLLKRVVRVSLETVKIVKSLPALNEQK